jgi:glutathione S-transferase
MTMKLIIGNKAYSSWSMRGWLACKQSGLHFEEMTVPLYDDGWDERRREEDLAPSSGKVPILWDGDAVIWDSFAILEYLADKVGRERFWPKEEVARGMARAMAAEMHSGFMSLRRECPMNLRKTYEGVTISEETRNDALRILGLWAEARARFGKEGPYLFGHLQRRRHHVRADRDTVHNLWLHPARLCAGLYRGGARPSLDGGMVSGGAE